MNKNMKGLSDGIDGITTASQDRNRNNLILPKMMATGAVWGQTITKSAISGKWVHNNNNNNKKAQKSLKCCGGNILAHLLQGLVPTLSPYSIDVFVEELPSFPL